ncbi:MAG: hypothetical protein FJ098_16185 [Deltaproteobacteria bacterium]|nr:hypothetical protein [Deltaproteobacteria bacterium]
MAPRVESHPFWARFMLEEVRAALGAAQQAVEAGEHGLAAEMLHDLAKVPAAGELFGSAFDPWLDAQGVYLMPADLQAEKIPGLVKALIERLDKAGQATLRQTGIELCMRLCGLARRHCPARCVSGEACDRSEAACSRGCDDKGTQSWPMPPFEVPPDSPDFWNKCMPERR